MTFLYYGLVGVYGIAFLSVISAVLGWVVLFLF